MRSARGSVNFCVVANRHRIQPHGTIQQPLEAAGKTLRRTSYHDTPELLGNFSAPRTGFPRRRWRGRIPPLYEPGAPLSRPAVGAQPPERASHINASEPNRKSSLRTNPALFRIHGWRIGSCRPHFPGGRGGAFWPDSPETVKQPSIRRWTPERAWNWYRNQPWLVGCNFLPSTAINQLEMFQAEDYAAGRNRLALELDWAAALGMNTLRVFLHDLLWEEDAAGFCARIDDFLSLCARRKIRPMLVIFDACHRPEPRLGRQPAPTPGIHNPGWAQSPAVSLLRDEARWPQLEAYVRGVLERFGRDERILAWDLYNEPCNAGFDGDESKAVHSARLVSNVFQWAQASRPDQPLTVCQWSAPFPSDDPAGHTEYQRHLQEAQRVALESSDIISFHNYGTAREMSSIIDGLEPLGRPLLCTEFMARTAGSRFETCLPMLKTRGVAAYHWGFVSGKSQTIFPWGSPAGAPEPAVWFHDILRVDGSAFDASETALFKELSRRG